MASQVGIQAQAYDLSDYSDQFFVLSSELLLRRAWQAALLPAFPARSPSPDAGGTGGDCQSKHPAPGHLQQTCIPGFDLSGAHLSPTINPNLLPAPSPLSPLGWKRRRGV